MPQSTGGLDKADVLKAAMALFKRATVENDFLECVGLFSQSIEARPDNGALYFHRGKCYFQLSQYQRSLFDFSMAIRLEPQVGKNFAGRGACFRKLGRSTEALRDFSDSIKWDKENASFYFDRAMVYLDEHDFINALADLTAALDKRYTDKVRVLLARGISFRAVGRLEESISDLKSAILIDSSIAEAHDHLGLSLAENGNQGLAIASFNTAIELEDSNPIFLNHRGLTLYKLGEHTKAAEDFNRALLADSSDAEVFFNRANALYKLGNVEGALRDYEEAIQRDPKNPVYLQHKGLLLEHTHDIRGAIKAFEAAVRANESFTPARFHLAVVFHLDKQASRALALLSGYDFPRDACFFSRRGLILADLDSFALAEKDFDKAIELEESADHFHARGRVRFSMKNFITAIEDYDKALDLAFKAGGKEPGSASILCDRGAAWVALDNVSMGIADFTKAIEISANSKDPSYRLKRGECFFSRGLLDLAEVDFMECIEIKKDVSDFHYKLGLVRYAQRRYLKAIDDFTRALELGPKEGVLSDLFYHLGVALGNTSNFSAAVEAFSRAIDRSDFQRPHYYHERAKSLQETGRHEEAVKDFSVVIALQPRNPRAYFRRGFSFKALKFFEEAADDFEAAKEFDTEDPRFHLHYRKIASVTSLSLGPAGFEDPHTQTNM